MSRNRPRWSAVFLIPAFAATTGLLLPTAGAQPVRVRVSAPPAPARSAPLPALIRSVGECATHIHYVPKRQACMSCVQRGGEFVTQGNGPGHCNMPTPPPPPPPPPQMTLRSVGECATHIPYVPKRQACMGCVQRGGTFDTQGAGAGYCNMPAPPPPPPPAQMLLRSVGECATHIPFVPKRQRCMGCVQRGGTFDTQGAGAGYCNMPAPPPPPPPPAQMVLSSVGECATHIPFVPKRQRCMGCVQRGGQFDTQGAGPGHCRIAPPPPPPPPAAPMMLDRIPECFTHIHHPGKRNHCRKCITRGGRWDLRDSSCRR